MELNNLIKQRRQELNLTLEQVAQIVGVGKSTVRKWETGDIKNMKRDKIPLLAEALQISPSLIAGFKETTTNLNKFLFSKEEQEIISDYRNLNEIGQKEAKKRIEELTYIDKYKKEVPQELKETKIPITIAAYGGKGIEVKEFTEEELKKIRKLLDNLDNSIK